MQQKYAYVKISEFRQAYKENVRYCKSLDEMKREIESNADDRECSIFEVLENNIRRVYFDIENIPYDKEETIHEIIKDLAEFMEVDSNNYALTLNMGSHHPGLSYHLTFPFKTHAGNILNLVRQFKLKHPEYINYIDECVYNINRLFRVPNQYGIVELNERIGLLGPCKYYYGLKKECKENTKSSEKSSDIHRIQRGELEDLIIQNINNIPMLDKIFDSVSKKKLPLNVFSTPKMTNTIIELLKYVNENNNDVVRENISLMKENLNVSENKFKLNTFREMIFVMVIFVMFTMIMLKK